MAGRGDHQQLVVAQVLGDQVRRQVRGLDEAEPGLARPDQVKHPGGVGDGQLDHGRRVARGLLGSVLPGRCALGAARFGPRALDAAQFDQPVRHQVLGDGLAGGDGEPVRHP